MRYSSIVASSSLVAVLAFTSHPSLAQQSDPFEKTEPAGCFAFDNMNGALQNDQIVTIKGGNCGGVARITASFSGKAQFFNAGKDEKKFGFASIEIRDNTGKVVCFQKDERFNTFNLQCVVNLGVNPYVSYNYTVRYGTNNVSDQPLPNLAVRTQYKPN
jgi:hypothetical protein